MPRPTGFWRDFRIQVFNQGEEKPLPPFSYSGEPDYICGEYACTLIGATVQLEFLAESFSPDPAIVQIDPPQGDQVTVSFDLNSIR
jgi:hypothetical protein